MTHRAVSLAVLVSTTTVICEYGDVERQGLRITVVAIFPKNGLRNNLIFWREPPPPPPHPLPFKLLCTYTCIHYTQLPPI